MPRHRLLPLAALAAATLALGACASPGSSTDPYGAVSAPGGAAPAPTDAGAAPAAAEPLLAAKDVTAVGTVVTDVDGFTLYRFDKDTAKPTPTTTCVDACATTWPPVTVDPKGKLALEGVDTGAIGMVLRPDGTSQLTLGGWPIYRYTGDTGPGTAAGQGMGGTWFAITPDGKKASGSAAGSGAAGGTGGGAGAGASSGAGAATTSGEGAGGAAGGASGGASGGPADGASPAATGY